MMRTGTKRLLLLLGVPLLMGSHPGTLQDAPAATAPPGPPAIDHSPLKCLLEDQHPEMRAAVAPESVQRSRVYFKAHQFKDWYYIEMETTERPNFLGILPKPLPGTEKVDYYLYALDVQLQTAQTPAYDPVVARACRRDAGGWIPTKSPSITIYGTTAGQPAVPPGFAAAGIVAFVTASGELLSGEALAAAPGGPPSISPGTNQGSGHSWVPWVLGGLGAAGLAALAADGGSDAAGAPIPPAPSAAPPSAAPSAPPSVSPSPGLICGYRALPETQAFPGGGGSGSCDISTASHCPWTPQSNVPWIQITGGKNASGSGRVRFNVAANNAAQQRRGFVRLLDNEGVFCQVNQNAGYTPPTPPPTPPPGLAWRSELEVAGGLVRVVVNGVSSPLHAQGFRAAGIRPGRNRVEAHLLTGASQPGVWRFSLAGLGRGSVRIEQGRPAEVGGETLVFRLRGEPGERIAFSFEMNP